VILLFFACPSYGAQMFLMVSTILGPATVLMMIAGAFNAVFGTNLYESFSMAVGEKSKTTLTTLEGIE
jgi:hypothetical protein